jgi:type IV pilus assembly protein PilE
MNLSIALRRRQHGVTLIELLIVVVIIGILAVVAYPSYQEQMRRTRRADGKAMLLDTAQRLERCYTRFNAYNDAGCDVVFPATSPEGFYAIAAPVLQPTAFTLNATPQNAQTGDSKCGVLRLKSNGQQGSLGADTDTADCW